MDRREFVLKSLRLAGAAVVAGGAVAVAARPRKAQAVQTICPVLSAAVRYCTSERPGTTAPRSSGTTARAGPLARGMAVSDAHLRASGTR
jgi:hypothetical protein